MALAAIVHALALSVFYEDGDSAPALHAVTPALRAEGIEGSPATKQLAEQHATWQSQLPDEDAALWDWLLAREDYLGRVSKTLILEAVTEAKGKAAADNIAALKKSDMADAPPNCSAAPGWLPVILRA